MTPEQLREEIGVQQDAIRAVVHELLALQQELVKREPTVREKVAAGTFLAQFYTGVENILKRISRFNNVSLPTGDTWHLDLFKRFCLPPFDPLPLLFDEQLAASFAPFRKFRHVVHHGYSFELDWSRMSEGIAGIEHIFEQFNLRLSTYLQTLQRDTS